MDNAELKKFFTGTLAYLHTVKLKTAERADLTNKRVTNAIYKIEALLKKLDSPVITDEEIIAALHEIIELGKELLNQGFHNDQQP